MHTLLHVHTCPSVHVTTDHVWFVSTCQPTQNEFATKLVSVDDHSNGTSGNSSGPLVRLVSVPNFASTGVVVLVDISTPELLTTTLHFR